MKHLFNFTYIFNGTYNNDYNNGIDSLKKDNIFYPNHTKIITISTIITMTMLMMMMHDIILHIQKTEIKC